MMKARVIAFAVLTSAVPSTALPVLDQFQDDALVNAAAVYGDVFAQTFTVGISGTLSRVEIFAGGHTATGSLTLEVRPTVLGLPVVDDGLVLASLSLLRSAFSVTREWVAYDVSSFGLAVVAGQVLAISVRAAPAPGTFYLWGATENDEYAGGTRLVRWGGSDSWELVRGDGGFRTFVEPVPEPSPLPLVGLCLAAIAVQRRRRAR